MEKKDDRTEEQRVTHRWGVVGRDKFLSGWGRATGGYSRAAWACKSLERAGVVMDKVRGRGDMLFVSLVDLKTYHPPRSTVHFHIYVDRGEEE